MNYCKVCGKNQFLVQLNENHIILTCTSCYKEVTLLGNVEVNEE